MIRQGDIIIHDCSIFEEIFCILQVRLVFRNHIQVNNLYKGCNCTNPCETVNKKGRLLFRSNLHKDNEIKIEVKS